MSGSRDPAADTYGAGDDDRECERAWAREGARV